MKKIIIKIINLQECLIYRKAEEILEIVEELVELVPKDNEILMDVASATLSQAMLLLVNIRGAEAGDLYDIRMERAAIIRKAARDIYIAKHSFRDFGYEYTDCFDLLRDSIEEFRLLFIDWVAGFDQWNYTIDRWGLFNPPGVGPFDHDPDDDIPFDAEGFFR